MSMSTHVMGFIPPDEKFKKMLEAYHACEAAGVAIPSDVEKFFNDEMPDEAGVRISLDYDKKYKDAVKECRQRRYAMGYEVDQPSCQTDIRSSVHEGAQLGRIRPVSAWTVAGRILGPG